MSCESHRRGNETRAVIHRSHDIPARPPPRCLTATYSVCACTCAPCACRPPPTRPHVCSTRSRSRCVPRDSPRHSSGSMTLGGLWRRVGLLLLLRVACASTVHGALLPGGICCCRGWVVDARLTTQCGYWLHISTPAADVEPHTLRGGRRTTRQTYRVPLPPPRGPRGALGPVLRRL